MRFWFTLCSHILEDWFPVNSTAIQLVYLIWHSWYKLFSVLINSINSFHLVVKIFCKWGCRIILLLMVVSSFSQKSFLILRCLSVPSFFIWGTFSASPTLVLLTLLKKSYPTEKVSFTLENPGPVNSDPARFSFLLQNLPLYCIILE